MAERQGKTPLSTLYGDIKGVVSSDDKGVISSKPISEITTEVVTEAVPKNIKENEVIAVQNGKFVGTGIVGKNGDGQFAAGTVSVGLHDISSGGENVVTANRASGKKYTSVWQEIEEGTNRPAVIRVNDETLQTAEFQTDTSTNITNPSYSLRLNNDVTIFESEYTAASAQTNVHFNLREQGATDDIWRSKPRDVKVGVNTFKLHVPLDLKANVDYVLSAYSDDGDVVLKGNSSNVPYFKYKYQTYQDKPLYPCDDNANDNKHTWTGEKINTQINQVGDQLTTSVQVLQSDINQKISGIHVEDADGNAFDDITALTFTGATVTDTTLGDAHILVSPEFTIADGQDLDSNSITGNAIVFNGGATVRTDINNSKVMHVDLPSGGSTGSSGIEIDDGVNNIASVKKINFKGAKVTEVPNQGGMGANETEITSGINIHMAAPNQQYGSALANEITVLEPLNVYDDANVDNGVKLEIKPGTFESMHAPGYLAYVNDDTIIAAKSSQNDKGHHKGTLWFDDIVVPNNNPYIGTDKENKGFTIEEADELDPNISGGTDYLIAFRVGMKGKASEDGFVKAYLYNKKVTPFSESGYLDDVNGQPLIVERHYKAGDELGYLEVLGVVNAKGQQEFTCHVVDSFVNDVVVVEDRSQGATGLMIQALRSTEKTGFALLQYEADTQQNIEFTSHYLGADRATIDWIINQDIPLQTGAASTGQTMADGMHFYNINQMKLGVQSGYLLLQDDGSNICDFNFGKIFTSEETKMLRGKEIKVTSTLVDKNNGFNIALMKWLGKPDEYTPEIFTSRNVTPTFQTNWVKVDDLFISEDAVSGDHVATKNFTVPSDANNYAVIIYPVQAQQPLTLKLKQFNVDVVKPFIGYALHSTEQLNEQHFAYSDQYKEFVQNSQGYASLRYTIGNSTVPMPIGIPGKGLADISLDTSVNQISGSSARGGEGAMRFSTDGKITIKTDLRLWNEISQNTTARFAYYLLPATANPGEQPTRIDDSVTDFLVGTGAKNVAYTMKTFSVDVEAGDRIMLKAYSNHPDGCFLQCVDDSKPLIKVTADFKELIITDSGDDPFADVDLSQFDKVHTGGMTVTKIVQNSASANIPLTLPSDVDMVVLDVVKHNSDGSIRKVKNLDYSYKDNILAVSFGETVSEAKIIIGVYI